MRRKSTYALPRSDNGGKICSRASEDLGHDVPTLAVTAARTRYPAAADARTAFLDRELGGRIDCRDRTEGRVWMNISAASTQFYDHLRAGHRRSPDVGRGRFDGWRSQRDRVLKMTSEVARWADSPKVGAADNSASADLVQLLTRGILAHRAQPVSNIVHVFTAILCNAPVGDDSAETHSGRQQGRLSRCQIAVGILRRAKRRQQSSPGE